MRTLATLSALALFGLVQPAAAQMMCAPGQQAQASTPASGGGVAELSGSGSSAGGPALT